MAAAGRSAGRVSIRVVPDAGSFRRDLKELLDRIENGETLRIGVEVDDHGIASKLRQVEEQVRRVKSDVTVGADTDAFRRNLDRSIRQLTTDNPVKLRLDMQVEDAERNLRKLREDAGHGPLTVEVQADIDAAERKVQELRETVEATKLDLDTKDAEDKISHLKREAEKNLQVKLKADLDTKKAALEAKRLARRRVVEIVAQLNKRAALAVGAALARLSGGRALQERINAIGTSLSNLDRTIPKIAAVALAVSSIGALGLSSVGGILTVAGSLSQLAGAAALLPALLTGGAAVVGVLTASLADAKTELAGLTPAFADLQNQISAKFWDQAKAPIIEVVRKLLPQLTTGLKGTATQVGGIVASLASGLQQGLGGGVLAGILANLNKGLGNARAGAENIGVALSRLGQVGSQYLPALGQAVSDVSQRFTAFVNKAADDGRLKQWIDGAITTLHQLGDVAGGAFGILKGLFTAAQASGGGGLSTLAAALQSISDVVNGSEFQKTLTTLFTGAAEGAKILQGALGPIGGLLSSLAPTIAGVFKTASAAVVTLVTSLSELLSNPAVTGGITALFQGIAEGVSALAPGLAALAPLLGQILSFAGTTASTLGTVLGGALTALAPAATALIGAIQPLVPILGQALVQAVQAIAPALTDFINQLAPYLPQLAAAFGQLVVAAAQLVPGFLQILGAITPLLGPIAELISAFAEANTAVSNVTMKGVPILVKGLGIITASLSVLVGIVTASLQVVTAIFQGRFSDIGKIIKGAMDKARSTIDAATGGIVTKFTSFVGSVVGKVTSGFSSVVSAVVGAMARFGSAVKSKIDEVLGFFSALPGRVVSALGSLGGLLVSAGSQAVAGFVQGLRNGLGSVISAAQNIARTALTAAKNALGIHSPSKEFAKIGKDVTAGLAKGITGSKSQAVAAINTVVQDLKDAYSKRNDSIAKIDKQLVSLQQSRIRASRRVDAAEDRLQAAKTKTARKAALRSLANARDDVKKYTQQAKELRSQKAALKDFTKADYTTLLKSIRTERSVLSGIAAQRDQIAAKIKTATSNLTAAIKLRDDYAAQVKAGIVSLGDVTQFQSSNGRTDAGFITTSLQDAVAKARKFRQLIEDLSKKGLNKTALQQIIAKGADAGSSVAQAILDGGSKTIKDTNTYQAQLDKIGKDLGKFTSNQFYQSGVDTAKGLLAGLKSQQAALTKQAVALAKALAKAVKKALGIKSPSKVFRRQVGVWIPRGIGKGISDGEADLTRQIQKLVHIPEIGKVRATSVAGLDPVTFETNGGGGSTRLTDSGDVYLGYDPDEVTRRLDRRSRANRLRYNLQSA